MNNLEAQPQSSDYAAIFNSISDAIRWQEHKTLNISVKKFEEMLAKYGRCVVAQPTKGVEWTDEQIMSLAQAHGVYPVATCDDILAFVRALSSAPSQQSAGTNDSADYQRGFYVGVEYAQKRERESRPPQSAEPVAWIDLNELKPNPEVFVLTWNGKEVGIDWWGSRRHRGDGVTHWAPFQKTTWRRCNVWDALNRRPFESSGSAYASSDFAWRNGGIAPFQRNLRGRRGLGRTEGNDDAFVTYRPYPTRRR